MEHLAPTGNAPGSRGLDPDATSLRLAGSETYGGLENEDRLPALKAEADALFREGMYKSAVRLYDAALDTALTSTPLELKRTVISNRAQAYLLYGSEPHALVDCDLALSPAYTLPSSPKILTAKCYYRRARILCLFRRCKEALEDYTRYEELYAESGLEVKASERTLQEEIRSGLNQNVEGREWINTQLMKAIGTRHIMIQGKHRARFPQPSPPVLPRDESEGILHFGTDDERPDPRLANPLMTPLHIPFMIRAPYLLDPVRRNKFSGVVPYSEAGCPGLGTKGQMVGTIVENLFSSWAITACGRLDEKPAFTQNVVDHSSPAKVSILLMTHRSRLLVIPHNTKIKDIWAGAKWPRTEEEGDLPFRDLRKSMPRFDKLEIDGAILSNGWCIELLVVPKEKVGEL
ncbi:hypothetical protein BOTBODRAFT_181885 [Botryobasidium botryosum FD-172 SS1]|uniref:Cns1/TTC4 wheel domain-containing protein n=1 Tax=Botryobasidium botryosum (strain FD-172 SS1) TaxID=930990 RepID=A0A067M3E5_BOTB1|nr:hypothetical protein BOTBODRAFT_181885 [Botryobasidium botryosum FD-172 SS1]